MMYPGARGERWGDLGCVAVGGAVGTLIRVVLDAAVGQPGGIPIGILVINVTGAFVLGMLLEGVLKDQGQSDRKRRLRLLLGTGVLGGYTTYSSLATGAAELIVEGRLLEGAGYGVVTLVAGGVASWLGILVGSTVRARGSQTVLESRSGSANDASEEIT